MTGTTETKTIKCPFCKTEFTKNFPPEAEEPFNIFTTPPTKIESIYYKDIQVWKPGHEGTINIWNQTFGITPLPEKNIHYWTNAIKCKSCNHMYDVYLFEKGNNPKKIWNFLFGDSYPIRLPFFSEFVDNPDGVFWVFIVGILLGLICMIPALISGGIQYILHDIKRWVVLIVISSFIMRAIVHHLKTAKKIKKCWKKYVKNLNYSGIDNDSWNFWCNFTEARFEGSYHKITQPLGAGLLSLIFLFITYFVFHLSIYTQYGVIFSELLFYGIMAFIVGIAFWVSLDATTQVIRTFSQFPLKINIIEPYSSVNEVSALAISSTYILTLLLMIPTSISILSFYGLTHTSIQWFLLWINILTIIIFILVAYSIPNLWLRFITILTLFIYLLSFHLQTTFSDLMPSIPIASIVSSIGLSILILITFALAMYPLYNVIKENRLNKIKNINMQLNYFLDSITEQKKLDLFCWEKIPGNDNIRLIEFLMQNFSIEWLKAAKIEKNDDGKTIRISSEKNVISLILNDEKTKVNLELDGVRIDEFNVKMENGDLNIYKKLNFPIELNILLQMKEILRVTSDFPVSTKKIHSIFLLSELPVVTNIISYIILKMF